MAPVRLVSADHLFPHIEKEGFRFIETIDLDGQNTHTVFENVDTGERLICPGIRGLPEERPMFTTWMVDTVIKNAKVIADKQSQACAD